MKRYQSVFERYLDAAGKTADVTLRWYYQKQMMMANLLNDAEIERIADRVLERLRVTVDIDNLRQVLKELDDEINKLGK